MSNYKKAILALILSNIIWGMGPPIFKWSLQNISPLSLAFLRFLIPVIILLPFFKNLQKVRIRDAFSFVLLGILNCTINIGFYFIGLKYTQSINAPIIASSGPIFLLIGCALFLGDKAKTRVLYGNLIGMAGVIFLVVEPIILDHHVSILLGNLLLVIATISAVLGTLLAKRLATRYNALTLVFWTFFVAAFSLLPIPLEEISQHTFLVNLNYQGIIGIVFGGIFSSLIAYFLWFWGLKYIKASETAIFTYIDPITAVLVAGPLLNEYPTPFFILGSFFVFLGIYIAEGRLNWHPLHKLLK